LPAFLKLRNDWDYVPRFDIDIGSFIERKAVQDSIVDFLHRRMEGTLLISGRRGIGKTSTIFLAIRQLNKILKVERVSLLPVLVDACSFIGYHPIDEESKSNLDFKHVLLQNLIRRLYKFAKKKKEEGIVDDDSYKKIKELFNLAVAKEVKEEIKNIGSEYKEFSTEKESKINLDLTQKLAGIGVSFISSIILTLNPIPGLDIWNKIIPILVGILPAAAISITWGIKRIEIHKKGEAEDTSKVYSRIYDVNDLQFEFENLLDILSKKYKVIFIIDELDKIEILSSIDIIRNLRTFFNLSLVFFILVSGEEFFNHVLRSAKYISMFSEVIFVDKPAFDDIRSFLDSVVQNKEQDQVYTSDTYHKFKDYICYASKAQIDEFHNIIRDCISHDDSGNLLLDIEMSDYDVIQAQLQTILEKVYSKKFYVRPIDRYKNEILLDKMYYLISSLTEFHSQITSIRMEDSPFKIFFLDYENRICYSIETDNKTEKEALTDLIRNLAECKFLKPTMVERTYELVHQVPKQN
jgi:KAP family P-loop domain